MKTEFLITRRARGEAAPFLQRIRYETEDESETVATALLRLNETLERPIRWDCSCLQKKCGACAMVINGRPGLACDARLSQLKQPVRLEPLKKFPVVEDLVVDRSVMFRNLEEARLWLETGVVPEERRMAAAYEASRCLQCGCCLEVCPNFAPGGVFAGMAAAVPLSRLLAELPAAGQETPAKQYRARVYAGCGKSLACRDVCPAGIDIESLLVNSNAAAVWKRFLKS